MSTPYPVTLYPLRFRRLDDTQAVAVSESGDHELVAIAELRQWIEAPEALPRDRQAQLKAKFFIGPSGASAAMRRLLVSRIAARKETVLAGPSLHILVPTLQCAHSCRYCQVSRALDDTGYAMSAEEIDAACDTIFESRAPTLTVEFQGGDPLLRFDLVRRAIERIARRNLVERRQLRFVVASTLHQLDEAKCAFFREHKVYLSTSLDGPAELHDRNRPLPGRDAHQRTLAGIALAREHIGPQSVSALTTITRASLDYSEQIVDEYVRHGFHEIFLRPLSHYGFAVKNARAVSYSHAEFAHFYERAFERILYWNREGIPIREAGASIALNKILSPFDAGYVDLQSPTGAGLAVLVYNYDGYVYPSDEARMLAEMGNTQLRLGRIGTPIATLLASEVERDLVRASLARYTPGCDECAYQTYCGPDPVNAVGRFGSPFAPVQLTDHCRRSLGLFDFLFRRLARAEEDFLDLAYAWAGLGEAGRVGNA